MDFALLPESAAKGIPLPQRRASSALGPTRTGLMVGASVATSAAKRTRDPTRLRPVPAEELQEFLQTAATADAAVLRNVAGDIDPTSLGCLPKTGEIRFGWAANGALRVWSATASCRAIDHAQHTSAIAIREGIRGGKFHRQSTYTDWPQFDRFVEGELASCDACRARVPPPPHSNTTPWVTQCVTLKLLCYDCVITFVLSLCNRLVSHCV